MLRGALNLTAANKFLIFVAASLLFIELGSCGCWGYDVNGVFNCDPNVVDCRLSSPISLFPPFASNMAGYESITSRCFLASEYPTTSQPYKVDSVKRSSICHQKTLLTATAANELCIDFRNAYTYYQTGTPGGPCSYCSGTLNCDKWNYIGSGCTDIGGPFCYRDGWGTCMNDNQYTCSSMNKAQCVLRSIDTYGCVAGICAGTHDQNRGCSWVGSYADSSRQRFTLSTGVSVYAGTASSVFNSKPCVWNEMACWPGYKRNPITTMCVQPACIDSAAVTNCVSACTPSTNATCINKCYANTYCQNNHGLGFFCNNSNQYNAECVVIPGFVFKASKTSTINGTEYLFSLRNDDNQANTYLDVIKTLGDTNVSNDIYIYYDIVSGQAFSLNNLGYKSYFSLPLASTGGIYSMALYLSPSTERLTYNIFPVCGNGVCETCESPDNCISYPPESCLGCPKDCPYLSTSDWVGFQRYKIETGLELDLYPKDTATDPDNACKVRTRDASSLCNPLCISHEYIDSMGCVFNRYSNAIPTDEFNNSLGNISYTANVDMPMTLELTNVTFNENTTQVYTTVFDDFYGFNNSLCLHNCECESNNCADCQGQGCGLTEARCCMKGYTWSYVDDKNRYCGNGRMLPEYRDVFEDYILVGETYIIKSTIDVNNPENSGVPVENFINIYGSGPDPYCVYEESREIIKIDGIGQCRKIRDQTIEVPVEDLKCTVHTHAWAVSTCYERKPWYQYLNPAEYDEGVSSCQYTEQLNRPYFNYFCVTDNTMECASKFPVMELYKNSAPVLRSITYKQFCTTPNLVCGSTKKLTNSQSFTNPSSVGGSIWFNSCPQDGLMYVDSEWYEDVTEGFPEPTEMSVGYYCSLFGNDYGRIVNNKAGSTFGLTSDYKLGAEIINKNSYSDVDKVWSSRKMFDIGFDLGVNEESVPQWMYQEAGGDLYVKAHHMPIIDRDANEKLYHYLWNYETCKEIYPDLVTFNCDDYNVMKDEKNQPITPLLGTYDFSYYYGLYGATWNDDKKTLILDASLSYSEGLERAKSRADWTTKMKKLDISERSREFCDQMWEYYGSHYTGDYNWITNPGFDYPTLSLTDDEIYYLLGINLGQTLISSARIEAVKLIIKNSCKFWYPPFLRKYYDSDIPVAELGIDIDSHLMYWGSITYKTIAIVPLLQYDMLDSTYMRNKGSFSTLGFCSASTGLILPFQKCSAKYPYALGDGQRNRYEPNNVFNKDAQPKDWTYHACSCYYLNTSANTYTYLNGKTGCYP